MGRFSQTNGETPTKLKQSVTGTSLAQTDLGSVEIHERRYTEEVMSNLRSYIDPDQTLAVTNPTAFKTGANAYEVRCNNCGELFFVSESVYLFAKKI